MRFFLTITTSLFFVLPSLAHGQDVFIESQSVADQCLPIGTIIDLSRQNSPEANIARAQINEAEADITAAKKLFEPQLSVFG